MFACCLSKKILTSVDLTGPSGCTGPNCKGPSGCVNKLLFRSGATGPSGTVGATGTNEVVVLRDLTTVNEDSYVGQLEQADKK
jgi:hypothetical protein